VSWRLTKVLLWLGLGEYLFLKLIPQPGRFTLLFAKLLSDPSFFFSRSFLVANLQSECRCGFFPAHQRNPSIGERSL
jgi:hypothetical protein